MNKIFIALIIGIIAGTIDVIPMIIQRIDKYACVSAFIQWIVLGLIIPYVNWDIQPWLKGLIIAEISALPIMIIVFAKEPKSIVPIVIFSAILGILVGISGARFVR
jgi:hypothetical protein